MDELFPRDEPESEPKGERKRVWGLALALMAFLAAMAVLYYFFIAKRPKPAEIVEAAETKIPAEAAEPAPSTPALEPLAFPAVSLAESDPVVRQFAAAIDADPAFSKWILTKDLIRKFVVSVDNVANGTSPKGHLDFFSLEGAFRVTRTRTGTFLDPASYARYAPVVGAVRSLDAKAAVRLYRAVEPLLQEAYNELGYPGVDFDETLVGAMSELLAVPVVTGPIGLSQKVLSYAMTDERLEELSPAQKQLLRMGPQGVEAVQAKIREIAAVMGIPASRLPQARGLTPAVR